MARSGGRGPVDMRRRYRVEHLAATVQRRWRSKADSTARSDAVVMFGSVPSPHRVVAAAGHGLHVGGGLGVGTLADGVFGVVEHVELAADHVAERADERGDERLDRAVALAVDRVRLAVDLELRLDRRAAMAAVAGVVACVVRTSWLRSRSVGSAGRYSRAELLPHDARG